MRSIDSETEEYTAAPRPRRVSSADAKPRTTRPKPRPVPDPEGPSARRRPAPKKPKKEYDFVAFIRDYRTHLAVGIIMCFVAIVMVLCSISFMFTDEADQSVMYGRTVSEIVDSGDTVGNVGGVVGAFLAKYLLVDTFGLGSFVLAVYIFVIGLAVMRAVRVNFFSFTFRCLFTAAAISVIMGLITYNRDMLFNLGGSHGYYVNTLLYQYADILGAFGVSVLLAGLLVAVYLNPLTKFFSMLGRVMKRKPAVTVNIDSPAEEEPVVSPLDAMEGEEEAEPENETEAEVVPAAVAAAVAAEAEAESEAPAAVPVQEEEAEPQEPEHVPQPEARLDAFESDDDDIAEAENQISDVPAASTSIEYDIHGNPVAVMSAPVVAPEKPAAPSIDVFGESPEEPAVAATEPDTNVTTRSLASSPGEPEMVIVARQPEAVSDSSSSPIRHGDHISINEPYDVRAEHSSYVFPSTDLLVQRDDTVEINEDEQLANKKLIVDTFLSYNIEIQRIEATVGPTVTLYEIVPAQGTRLAKIKSLEDDIAMSLSALSVRIIAPIPGKGTVGIEVPNRTPRMVSMRTVLESKTFANNKMQLPMALGATISNDIYMADLAKMPHLLVAGATGQGKSVGLNCIITSLLYSKHPDELKFVLVDPKTVEFSLFETIDKQYLAKLPDEEKAVLTDPQHVMATLNSLCTEMELRYQLLSDARVRNIIEYNERFTKRALNPEKGHRFLPYIVVIVDEYADLVMVAGKDNNVAVPIARIAQKARAVGIHMIIATQRPSTDVITGMIKANFTARIAFKVTQGVDSKTILDRPGAQRLIGRGDMLTMMNGVVERVQCAFIDTPEVEAIVSHIGSQKGFVSCYLLPEPAPEETSAPETADFGAVTEEFKNCALFISSQTQASITSLQRKFEIGFNKAGRFMDKMQQMGIVGPAKGAKPRDVLMTPDEVQRLFE